MIDRRSLIGGALLAGLFSSSFVEGSKGLDIAAPYSELRVDVAVIGGGVGGIAAALGALRNGATVLLSEESDWLGGQLTSQLVPPDEHRWIEPSKGAYGQTATYRKLRAAVRQYYKDNLPVTDAFKAQNEGNPGNAWVSRLAAYPSVWRHCIGTMLSPYLRSGKLVLWMRHRPTSAAMNVGRIESVTLLGDDGIQKYVFAGQYIDSTELGDLLPLTGCNHTVGRESETETGEMHNEGPADPTDQQSFTMVMAVGYNRAGGDHTIAKPADYDKYKPWFDEFFQENLFDPTQDYSWDDGPNFWQYRRVAALTSFKPAELAEEIAFINLECNDYTEGNLLGVSEIERAINIGLAKQQSLSLLYYLQTEVPRIDGSGRGYRALRLRPDVAGTIDGIAKRPYIREGRRMRTLGRIFEWHIGVDNRVERLGLPDTEATAAQFADSVGTGHYWLDVHASGQNAYGWYLRCYPYQIPLMALIPNNITNLLAGGKSLGTTHMTNGAYRVHSTEWSVGEAAGVVAAYCQARGLTPRDARATKLAEIQSLVRSQGFQLAWPAELRSQW